MTNAFLNVAKNITYVGKKYCPEVENTLPTFKMERECAEKWNEKAKKQNTKMFIQITGRKPRNYDEVRAWMNNSSSTNKKSRCANIDFPVTSQSIACKSL